jgi:hypothetical protein
VMRLWRAIFGKNAGVVRCKNWGGEFFGCNAVPVRV